MLVVNNQLNLSGCRQRTISASITKQQASEEEMHLWTDVQESMVSGILLVCVQLLVATILSHQ